MVVIAVTGKGGTGKTVISALLIHSIAKDKRVLAVDADPDSNLPDALGVEGYKTLGEIKEIFQEGRDEIGTVNKEQWLEGKIYGEVIYECDNFDLLVMGWPEGEGCYCYANNLLRGILGKLMKNYDAVIVDCEAGLEHFSRKTIESADYIIIVIDMSTKGLATAKRIKEMSEKLNLNSKEVYLVGNKIANKDVEKIIEKFAKDEGLRLLEVLPYDEKIVELDLKGEAVIKLPKNFEYTRKIREMAKVLVGGENEADP